MAETKPKKPTVPRAPRRPAAPRMRPAAAALAPMKAAVAKQPARTGAPAPAVAMPMGTARALVKQDQNLRPQLRALGYLTRDSRAKERKKPGLKRARRAHQFSKR